MLQTTAPLGDNGRRCFPHCRRRASCLQSGGKRKVSRPLEFRYSPACYADEILRPFHVGLVVVVAKLVASGSADTSSASA